jgi:hypothetical protein
MLITGIALLLIIVSSCSKKEPIHEHVRTKHYVTKYRLEKVTFCKTEYKILLHDGTRADIVLPVILFPEMEEAE